MERFSNTDLDSGKGGLSSRTRKGHRAAKRRESVELVRQKSLLKEASGWERKKSVLFVEETHEVTRSTSLDHCLSICAYGVLSWGDWRTEVSPILRGQLILLDCGVGRNSSELLPGGLTGERKRGVWEVLSRQGLGVRSSCVFKNAEGARLRSARSRVGRRRWASAR